MTNSTEKPSRRAALGALAIIPALALPAVAMAAAATAGGSSAHLDAELFALIDAAREAEARYVAASDACDEAYDRTEKVPAPEALIVAEDDTRLWKLKENAGDPLRRIPSRFDEAETGA